MNNYLYDGSFYGLLTLVFDAYVHRKNIGNISSNSLQINFNSSFIEIKTDIKKAVRVEKYIKNNISKHFLSNINIAFLSSKDKKDNIIVQTIFEVMKNGKKEFYNIEGNYFLLKKIIAEVLRERHRYLGLLRFKELDSGILFATFEPKHNILPIVVEHFLDRLRNELFAIYDKKRGIIAYYNAKEIAIYDEFELELKFSDNEEKYSDLWKVFHNAIAIDYRKNKKLQQSNLPKYYWKHLIENMEL